MGAPAPCPPRAAPRTRLPTTSRDRRPRSRRTPIASTRSRDFTIAGKGVFAMTHGFHRFLAFALVSSASALGCGSAIDQTTPSEALGVEENLAATDNVTTPEGK